MYSDTNLKLLSGKNTQKVNKQKIQDSENWVFDELNEINDIKYHTENVLEIL